MDKVLLSMRTLNRAVVRIFSWYVTWRDHKSERPERPHVSETTTGETRKTTFQRYHHRGDQKDNISEVPPQGDQKDNISEGPPQGDQKDNISEGPPQKLIDRNAGRMNRKRNIK